MDIVEYNVMITNRTQIDATKLNLKHIAIIIFTMSATYAILVSLKLILM